MRDVVNNILARVAIPATAITTNTTVNGLVIDTQGMIGGGFLIQSATITDGTFTPVIKESDDPGMSGETDVPDLGLSVTEASIAFVAADDNTVKKINVENSKRFITIDIGSTAVTTGGTIGATYVAMPSQLPAGT